MGLNHSNPRKDVYATWDCQLPVRDLQQRGSSSDGAFCLVGNTPLQDERSLVESEVRRRELR